MVIFDYGLILVDINFGQFGLCWEGVTFQFFAQAKATW